MENLLSKFYLDKEKDIIVKIFKTSEDEVTYILETPNHNTGNLITNLARICNVETVKNENDMKIIKGVIPASINGDNEIVYIFRLGGFKIANIFENGKVEIKAQIPAITKTIKIEITMCNIKLKIFLIPMLSFLKVIKKGIKIINKIGIKINIKYGLAKLILLITIHHPI